jgi:molybdopterin-synthase adenylyltransferase
MSTLVHTKPRLPTHYHIRFEPPDHSGEEVLFFSSERRRIKLKGHSFREFLQSIVPLLDGEHTMGEIQAEVASLFAPEDVRGFLGLLAEHNILQDAEPDTMAAEVRSELEPQLNFFHELGLKPHEVQRTLSAATVVVWGLGGAGAAVALSLAAAQIGNLRCVDSLPVSRTDPLLAPAFVPSDIGRMRSDVICGRIAELSPRVRVQAHTDAVTTDSDVLRIIEGTDFLVCCADMGSSSQFYMLNRACLQARISWTSCSVSGLEGIIGPTIVPFETACFLCYKMRAVACAANPEDEFSFQRFLDRRRQDDSGRRENTPFGGGAVGNLVGLEALKYLTGRLEPSVRGQILVIDLLSLACRKHAVLRKPWCPACFPKENPGSR